MFSMLLFYTYSANRRKLLLVFVRHQILCFTLLWVLAGVPDVPRVPTAHHHIRPLASDEIHQSSPTLGIKASFILQCGGSHGDTSIEVERHPAATGGETKGEVGGVWRQGREEVDKTQAV